jgi:hypothetical protein
MRNALRAEGDRLAALGEPLAVNRGVEHAFATLDGVLERLANPRLDPVRAPRRMAGPTTASRQRPG